MIARKRTKWLRRSIILFLMVVPIVALLVFWYVRLSSPFGVWQVNTELSLARVKEMPSGLQHHFKDVAEYRQWLGGQIRWVQFNFRRDGTVKIGRPGFFSPSARATWSSEGFGNYWLYQGVFMSAGLGHRFSLHWNGTASCLYQVEWTENGPAPRTEIWLDRVSK